MTDDEKIEAILNSLGKYAIGDIKANIHLPIACFILCSCFIDQMASYRYSFPKPSKRYKEFIEEYFPEYREIKLFENLRSGLVHHYSLKYLKITGERLPKEYDTKDKYATIISLHSFLEYIKIAFDNFSLDIRGKKEEAKQNAINRFKDYPPLEYSDYVPGLYTENDADKLVSFYSPCLINSKMADNHELKIFLIEKEKITDLLFAIKVYAKGIKGITHWKHLDEIAQEQELASPTEVLFQNY